MSNLTPSLDTTIPPALHALPLTLSVRIGQAKKTVKEVASLSEGSLLELDTSIEDPVDLCIEDQVIAKGELIQNPDGEGLSLKVIEIVANPTTAPKS